jgi:cell wall assembly regulator SMI1
VSFPDEVRASYLVHDGTKDSGSDTVQQHLFPPFMQFARLDEVVCCWEMWLKMYLDGGHDAFVFPDHPEYVATQPEMKIQPVYLWDKKWIPIGTSGTPSKIFLDLNPGPNGTYGQLLVHHGVYPPEILDSGLNNFLEILIKRIEAKEVFHKDGQWHWTKVKEAVTTHTWVNSRSI